MAVHTAPNPHADWARTRSGALPENTTMDTPKDRKSTRLNSSHLEISYAGFCLKKKSIVLIFTSGTDILQARQVVQDRLLLPLNTLPTSAGTAFSFPPFSATRVPSLIALTWHYI